ncbi:hypothetical protein E0I61_08970 [Flavobacterium ranwuense]|uniref:Putative beta-lactamase-inhibitor-like PepSY-like domain-containing protein n=1 Tax=Flavobacterium ranwuense TaxID=2541725 RepID=A0ABY2DRG1_9FLAO|nr:PepSY-like domain-containing protein [Flavobacterium ranwuense]TDE29284.1 hypothetical protein E0I61_08970 [Flavobacterium ranwuense]
MKKLAMVLALSMLTFISFGQKVKDKNVPQIIKNALHQKYPDAKGVKWDKEKNNYEASFDKNNVDNSILITPEGKIIEMETEIQITELPKNVTDYVKKHYTGQKNVEAAKITDVNGKVTFEAEIKGKDLIFDSNGNFIKATKD